MQESPKPASHIRQLSLFLLTTHPEGSVCDHVTCPMAPPQKMLHLRSYKLILVLRLVLGHKSQVTSLDSFDFSGAHYKAAYRECPRDSESHVIIRNQFTSGTGFWETSRNATRILSPLSHSLSLTLILPVTLEEIKKEPIGV